MSSGLRHGGGIELTSWSSGKTASDFGANLGGELLWLKYIEQRAGTEVIGAVAASERTGMLNIAMALDPSLPEDQAVEASVYTLVRGLADNKPREPHRRAIP
jgi:hypothetical protein